ncbi:unnamed protein product [Closterium sp. Naga37s-1]|nr:unnamed protein product [Closterium sp. Naga37s-1]
MRDSGEVEVLEDVMEEEQDELVPNPFYPALVVTPPDVTVEMEEEAVLAAEVEEADEEAVPAKSDSSKSDDGNAGEADEWSDEGDEWWASGRYEGAEVEEWVAGDEDEYMATDGAMLSDRCSRAELGEGEAAKETEVVERVMPASEPGSKRMENKDADAWDVDAWDADAWDVDAWDVDAWDADAWDVDAWDVDAWDVDAWDVDTWR